MTANTWKAGAVAGFVMNLFGWIGNQVLLGRLWREAIRVSLPGRQRGMLNEIVSLAPDFVYGFALAWLIVVLFKAGESRRVATAKASLLIWSVGAMTTYAGIWNTGWLPGTLVGAGIALAALVIFPAAWLASGMLLRRDHATATAV